MESSPAPKSVAFGWGCDGQEYVCHGVGVDGKWEHQRVCDGTPGCESFRTRKFFIRTPDTSFVVDNRATLAVRRCGEGLDAYARTRHDPWGS